MLGSERDNGKPAFAYHRGASKNLIGFHLGKLRLASEWLSGTDFYFRNFGVGGIHGNSGGGADGGSKAPSFINNQFRASFHFAQVLYSCGAGDAIPQRDFVSLEMGECVFARISLE